MDIKKRKFNGRGFTLIELLIVIAIIAILAATIFVALDPLTRFQDSRDSRRWQDASAIATAINIDQVDNGGSYLTSIAALTTSSVYMIVDGGVVAGCDNQNTYCETNVTNDGSCVDLSGLVVEGYLGDVAISPDGSGTWTDSITGYTLQRHQNGTITVRACEHENSSEIELMR
ncbi:MAG: prepilin-type N-terminal cleavage/methylation domain-containing protein [bacterium]